jgi:hypothetical protein
MRKYLVSAFILMSLPWSTRLQAAEEIDRLLASVNGRVITESDLRVSRDLNLLLQFGKRPKVEPSREEELKRLVDLELIRQELESFPLAADDQSGIDAQIADLKTAYAELGGLASILNRLGLQEEELESYIHLQASIGRFVEVRFNPFVTVTPEEIQDYYRDQLVPKLEKAGAFVPPIAEVSKSITEVLTESKVSASLENWITGIRGNSRIESFAERGELAGVSQPEPQAAPGTKVAPGQKGVTGIGRIKP